MFIFFDLNASAAIIARAPQKRNRLLVMCLLDLTPPAITVILTYGVQGRLRVSIGTLGYNLEKTAV